MSETKPQPTELRAPEETSDFDFLETMERILAHTLPPGANTIGGAEIETSWSVAEKLFEFKQRAKSLFKEIEGEFGVDRAKDIFGALAASDTHRSKRKVEHYNNILLLQSYVKMKLPVQQSARRLANGNDGYVGPFGARYRNGTAEAIEQQLKRLLKRDPAKEGSIVMRVVLAEARTIHEDLGFKPGRPRRNK